jgi:two-component system sensor histidine kinase MtrB
VYKLSLRLYFLLSFLFSAMVIGGVSWGLWSASEQLERTASKMNESVERIAAAENILDDLTVHRRQALLKDLRTSDERERMRKVSEGKLLNSLAVIEGPLLGSQERVLLDRVRNAVDAYLSLSNSLKTQDAHGFDLYLHTADAYDNAVTEISTLVRVNEIKAQGLELRAIQQGRTYKFWSIALFVAVLLSLGLVSWLRNRLIYFPIMTIRRAIDDYSRSQAVVLPPLLSVREIGDIARAFNDLVLSLQQQNEKRLVFLSAVAHDIKNPLSAIQTSLELLADSNSGEAQNKQISAIMTRQVRQLRQLVDDLLDATRIEAGHLKLSLRAQDLGALLRDAVMLFNSISNKHQLNLSLPTEPVILNCDSVRMGQVFNNILSNAIKYSPSGGEVNVALQKAGDFAIVSVADHGIGIESSDFELIFQPFRRPRSEVHHIPGVGLGLSTSRRIIEAHRGWIRLQSRPGQGTVFLIALPLSLPSELSNVPDLNTELNQN